MSTSGPNGNGGAVHPPPGSDSNSANASDRPAEVATGPAAALTTLVKLLARLTQTAASLDGSDVGPLEVSIRHGRLVATLVVRPAGEPQEPAPPMPELTRCARRILAVATDEPQTAKALAARAGYTMGGHINKAINELCQAGLLARGSDGWTYHRPRPT